MSATLVTRGAASFSSSSHLPVIDVNKLVIPVELPSGRAMLFTTLLATGSPTFKKTIGMVRVRCCTARACSAPLVTIYVGGETYQFLGVRAGTVGIDTNVA